MNKDLKIIPTPKLCTYTDGKPFNIQTVCVIGENSDILKNALLIFSSENNITYTDLKSADFVIYTDFSKVPDGLFTESELSIFNEKYAKDQGYVLKYKENEKAVALACNSQGAAYSVMTLLQIVGKNVGSFSICDAPDFEYRGVKWVIWAETGCWSYDFGDGKEAIKKRMARKIDMLFKYKINYIYADGFGFGVDRFDGYSEIMRYASDHARKRGIKFATGGYAMSYGCKNFRNSLQGKDFYNRKSYPDGEIYECIGTINRGETEVKAREHGTCLSNEALFEEKVKEFTEYIKETHITAMYLHNMDASELYPELWLARCDECRKRWPNDSLFTKDGAAGAFAEFFDKLAKRLHSVKDGDYDSSELIISLVSPGYLYEWTTDETFDRGINFWKAVASYMTEKDNVSVGFREQFFFHDKDEVRAKYVEENFKHAKTFVVNFNGCDGFYDDKIFSITSSLNYILKGYDFHLIANGNAFQEPLAIFDAEYLWNCENSAFYNYPKKPENYEEFLKLYEDMKQSKIRPDEIYGEGGFIDIICNKLYGEKIGADMAKIYKLSGKNGEPPIACASSVDIYTQFSKLVLPMRWDNEMSAEEIDEKCDRFYEAHLVSEKAHKILSNALIDFNDDENIKADLNWLCECFFMGSMMTSLLEKYMELYKALNARFINKEEINDTLKENLLKLKEEASAFDEYVKSSKAKPLDKFGGSHIKREEMAEFFVYNAQIMEYSIVQKQRIPEGTKELPKGQWW